MDSNAIALALLAALQLLGAGVIRWLLKRVEALEIKVADLEGENDRVKEENVKVKEQNASLRGRLTDYVLRVRWAEKKLGFPIPPQPQTVPQHLDRQSPPNKSNP